MEEERGPRCGIENCRSKRYHLGEDGYRYCSNGHRAQTQVATQDEDFVTAISRRTRKKAEAREAVTTVFEGRQAVELYLQCFQLILWKQAAWLVQKGRHPAELEIVIRDLWTLRLEMLKGILEDTQDTERFFSSQQSETEDEDATPGTRTVKVKKLEKAPKLIETLGLCYIAMVLMRLPIMSGDVRDWVMDGDFTYLRAIQAIPAVMRQRLPPPMRRAFHVQTGILDLGKLHATTMNLAAAFQNNFGMEIPPLNHTLLAFRLQTALCLPLEILSAINRLQPLINITYTFPFPPRKHTPISTHPELQLLTALIIAVKLLYPFDAHPPRHPTRPTEPAALAINWPTWNRLHAEEREQRPPKSQTRGANAGALEVREEDVFDMSTREIDDYLSWFGRTWIEADGDASAQGPDADFHNALYAMFPTNPDALTPSSPTAASDAAHVHRLKAVQASLTPLKAIPEPDESTDTRIQRPGSLYKHYRGFGEVPEVGRVFFEEAAGLANMEVGELVLAVFQMEMRLQRWVRGARRGGQEEEEEEGGDGEG